MPAVTSFSFSILFQPWETHIHLPLSHCSGSCPAFGFLLPPSKKKKTSAPREKVVIATAFTTATPKRARQSYTKQPQKNLSVWGGEAGKFPARLRLGRIVTLARKRLAGLRDPGLCSRMMHVQRLRRRHCDAARINMAAQTFTFANRAQPIYRPLHWTICPPPSLTAGPNHSRVFGVD